MGYCKLEIMLFGLHKAEIAATNIITLKTQLHKFDAVLDKANVRGKTKKNIDELLRIVICSSFLHFTIQLIIKVTQYK